MGTIVTLYVMVVIFALVLVAFKKIHWIWLPIVLIPLGLLLLLVVLILALCVKYPPKINQREVDKITPKTDLKFGVNPKIVDFTSGFKGMYNFTGRTKRRK